MQRCLKGQGSASSGANGLTPSSCWVYRECIKRESLCICASFCQQLAPSKRAHRTGESENTLFWFMCAWLTRFHPHRRRTHTRFLPSHPAEVKVWRWADGSKSDRWPSQPGFNINDRERTAGHTETHLKGGKTPMEVESYAYDLQR